jgi:hypothetical protein
MRGAVLSLVLAGCAAAGPPDVVVPDCNGLPCDAIHVATDGNDLADGSPAAPLKSIHVAIVRASIATPKLAVFLRAGVYTESIEMAAGVSIYGGFDEGWRRDPAATTELVGDSPVVRFESIKLPTRLDGLTVRSRDAMDPGASSYAIVARASRDLELDDVVIEAGLGAAGTGGTEGGSGEAAGANGVIGQAGCEASGGLCARCSRPPGGAGGFSFCGNHGGRGGDAGHGGTGGFAGSPGIGGTSKPPRNGCAYGSPFSSSTANGATWRVQPPAAAWVRAASVFVEVPVFVGVSVFAGAVAHAPAMAQMRTTRFMAGSCGCRCLRRCDRRRLHSRSRVSRYR